MQDLANTLAEVRRRIEQGVKRRLNEQNTKATLIEPVTVIGLRTDGRYPHTNGWSFWRMQGPGGKPVPVDDARQRYVAKGGSEAAG
jgi:hypothetical protein